MTEILPAVSPSVFSWSMLGRRSSAAFLLPRLEKGVWWPTPCRTHPVRVVAVALELTDLVTISRNAATGRATRRHFFVTLPTPFLITFSSRTTCNRKRILQRFRIKKWQLWRLKKTKALLWISKSKIVTNFSSIQTCSLCEKQVLQILLVILLLTQRRKYLGLLE